MMLNRGRIIIYQTPVEGALTHQYSVLPVHLARWFYVSYSHTWLKALVYTFYIQLVVSTHARWRLYNCDWNFTSRGFILLLQHSPKGSREHNSFHLFLIWYFHFLGATTDEPTNVILSQIPLAITGHVTNHVTLSVVMWFDTWQSLVSCREYMITSDWRFLLCF